MNYRHAYHAGNFADVLKHAVFALVIEHLKRKDTPFRVIDTHAGVGRYLLTSAEAEKTGEWRQGIGRLVGSAAPLLPAVVERRLKPYLDAVRSENAGMDLRVYPGSPVLALRLMRPGDVLVANELHPEDCAHLQAAVGRDKRAKVTSLDGWVALKSLLPPKERRGVVLIDPAFEQTDEFDRMAEGLANGLKRFATGIFLAWYPIKDIKRIDRFHAQLDAVGLRKRLRVELLIRRPDDPDLLNGCGLAVANPPYTLHEELAAVLPELARRLAAGAGARHWLSTVDEAAGGAQNTSKQAKRGMRSSR